MPSPTRIALLALAFSLVACHDDPEGATGPATASRSETSDGAGARTTPSPEPPPPVVLSPPDPEKQKADQIAWRAEMDRYGRGLLESFRARVYDPVRDGRLRFAEGTAVVTTDAASGRFHVTFDAVRPPDDRVVVLAAEGVDDLPKGSEEQVRRFARTALAGAYRTVVHYLPPVELIVTKSRDGQHRVVTAPPHHAGVQVSYSVDDHDLIAIRGTSVLPVAEIDHYEWTFSRGRYFLERQWIDGTQTEIECEYDDRDTHGVVLLARAVIRKEGHSFAVSFKYDRVEVAE